MSLWLCVCGSGHICVSGLCVPVPSRLWSPASCVCVGTVCASVSVRPDVLGLCVRVRFRVSKRRSQTRNCYLHLPPAGGFIRVPSSGGEGRGEERRGGISPPLHPPRPHPHSLSPGIEPYLESRFDICFQI